MKKKNKKKIIIAVIVVIIAILIIVAVVLNNKKQSETSTSTTTLVETQVSTQTIQKTLTGSGQIETSSTEKIELTTTYYFSSMCVEEGDAVKAGENILKYSNGTYLTSPYDCIIGTYSVPESGSKCTSSNYIEIKNTAELNMTLSVNESEINSVKVGQSVSISVNAISNKTYNGTITKIDSIGSYSTSGSTFTATILFSNDGDIKLGMSASCTVILEEAANCIAVPISAIQTSGDEKYVIVVKDNSETENVTVETGISNDNYVEIKSGLEGTETIKMLQTTSTQNRTYQSGSTTGTTGYAGGKGQMMQTGTTGGTMTRPSGN